MARTAPALTDEQYRRINQRAVQGMRPADKARYLRTHRLLPEPVVHDDGYRQTIEVPSLSHPDRTHTVTRHWERSPLSYTCDCESSRVCWHLYDARAAWDQYALTRAERARLAPANATQAEARTRGLFRTAP